MRARQRVHRPWIAAMAAAVALAAGACQRHESVEATRARAAETVLTTEIADLHKLIAKNESGQLGTADRIAIGIAEETSRALLDASLPQEKVIGERFRIRIDEAQPFFRGNNAALGFHATATSLGGAVEAHLELVGRLTNFRIEKGKLISGIELVHFKVLDSSLGNAGSDVLENVVRSNLGSLSGLLPGL